MNAHASSNASPLRRRIDSEIKSLVQIGQRTLANPQPSHVEPLTIKACLSIGLGLLLVQGSAAVAQVTYQQAKEIFPRNTQDHCFDGPYYAASHDRWLVLAQNGLQWEMQQAVIRNGRVLARRGIGRFFIKQLDLSLLPRKVKAATIYTRLNNGHMSESSFRLDGKRWRWIEWGASEFYLEQAAHRWVIGQSDQVSAGKMLVPGRAEVPPAMRALPFVERDLYEPGNMVLHWAGDLNGDGLPEFITYRQIKEAWGTLLWSAVRSATGGITVKVIAEGSDGCS